MTFVEVESFTSAYWTEEVAAFIRHGVPLAVLLNRTLAVELPITLKEVEAVVMVLVEK